MTVFSKRDREGYLLVDHRDSPGITAGQAAKVGSELVVGPGERLETPTYTCCGCTAVVIIRPDRSRLRTYCRQCDSYMCDKCSLVAKVSGQHVPFSKFVATYMDAAAKGPHQLAQIALEQKIMEAQRASILKGVQNNGT
jgi:hypothetical protein